MKRTHGLFLFVTSCVPGCGQMYQGYMKRGISLTLSCCILFCLAMGLYLEYLLIFLIPLWLFSFFDSYNLRSQTEEQAAANPDSWPFGLFTADTRQLTFLLRRRSSLLGWGLVLLGIYILFDTFVGRAMNLLCDHLGNWYLYDLVMRDLPRMAVTIGIIALGIWFIRGPKQPKEDIPAFTPPAPEHASAEADPAAPMAEPAEASPVPAEEDSAASEVPHDEV